MLMRSDSSGFGRSGSSGSLHEIRQGFRFCFSVFVLKRQAFRWSPIPTGGSYSSAKNQASLRETKVIVGTQEIYYFNVYIYFLGSPSAKMII